MEKMFPLSSPFLPGTQYGPLGLQEVQSKQREPKDHTKTSKVISSANGHQVLAPA